jgi:signal transduction histidine kinase
VSRRRGSRAADTAAQGSGDGRTAAAVTIVSAPIAALRRFPLLSGLPDDALGTLATGSRPLHVAAGDIVMREGSEGDGLYLLLDGELEVSRRSGDEEIVLGVQGPGEFFGELSLLENVPRTATLRARTDCELIVVTPRAFEELLARHAAVSLSLFHIVLERLRSTQAAVTQHARLVSLGTLAAGLAHEINNPAAALRRGIAQLRELIEDVDSSARAVGAARAGRASLAAAVQTLGTCRHAAPLPIGSGAEQEAEDRLRAWLAEQGVAGGAELAARLLAGGWSPASLQVALAVVTPGPEQEHVATLLHWLGSRCAAHALIDELLQSAVAITDIVHAVREHSAPGRSGRVAHDLAQGLESTLLVLRSRFAPSITIARRIEADLPPIDSASGQLNQLWSNLVENALDAMPDGGVLELAAWRNGDTVVVQVGDDGAGIPDDVQPRVFDPFFTTKPGGTGLGLHIAQGIVRRHDGSIALQSRPGHTVVTVILPVHNRSGGG